MTHDGIDVLQNSAVEINDEDIKPNFLNRQHYTPIQPVVSVKSMSALTSILPDSTAASASIPAAAHQHYHRNFPTSSFHGYHEPTTTTTSPNNSLHQHHHHSPYGHSAAHKNASPFLFSAEIYKSLFASAVLQQQHQQQQQQHAVHQYQQHKHSPSPTNLNNNYNASGTNNCNELLNENNDDGKNLSDNRKSMDWQNGQNRSPSPIIKSHVLQQQKQPFPRNLLFSCNESNSDITENKKPSFAWTSDAIITSSSNLANNNINNNNTSSNNRNNSNINSTSNSNNNQPSSPLGNHSDTILRTVSLRNPTNSNNTTTVITNNSRQQSGEETPVSGSISSPIPQSTAISPSSIITPSSSATTMPVHQGQNPTQGLVHWMSAVMAEHIQGNTHHDPTVGMHYMWNGGVDQCGQHSKDIDYSGWPPAPRNPMTMKQGYEAKMNDHHNLQKGHILDDGRLDHHPIPQATGHQMAIYGASTTGLRPASSSSSSPGGGGGGGVGGGGGGGGGSSGPGPGPATSTLGHHGHHSSAAAALLVVPQPINATKITTGLTNGGGTGRKYQCKMCPQVRKVC